ncbi:MAG: FAD-dependent monooxygenase [Chloroflexi bacterium]|nr:FAD-dependent monooxygenase [Chloroflexota bacterium]
MQVDAVIVGARVAGASLALQLGQQGRRVVLVDRARFPSDTLSTHLALSSAVAALDRLGVLADVEATGLRRMTRMRTTVEDCVVEGPVMPADGKDYALAPRRSHLDHVLLTHAVRHSTVELRQGTTVEGIVWEGNRAVGVKTRTPKGRHEDIHARVVVGADGRFSKVAEWVEAAVLYRVPALRPGFYAYYHDIDPLPYTACELLFQGSHVGFLFPMESGTDLIAVELDADDFDDYRTHLEERFEARVRALPFLRERMARARRDGPIYGSKGVDNVIRTASGRGWVVVGDAACSKDPITGSGISDALSQASVLAGVLGRVFDGADWDASLRLYVRARDQLARLSVDLAVDAARQGALDGDDLRTLRGTLAVPFFAKAALERMGGAVQQSDSLTDASKRFAGMLQRTFANQGDSEKPPAPSAGEL